MALSHMGLLKSGISFCWLLMRHCSQGSEMVRCIMFLMSVRCLDAQRACAAAGSMIPSVATGYGPLQWLPSPPKGLSQARQTPASSP